MDGAATLVVRGLLMLALALAGSGHMVQASSRSLLETEQDQPPEGRHLMQDCIYVTDGSSLVCEGYPYPACCDSTGSLCYEYSQSIRCTNPATPYPGCCSRNIPNPSPATPSPPNVPNPNPQSSKCFPGSALLTTPHGEVAMRDLKLGDKVLTANSVGNLQYETVFMFSHLDSSTNANFIALRTSSNKTITLTPGHYLWATINESTTKASCDVLTFLTCAIITTPEMLSVGDFLWIQPHNVSDSVVEPTRITEINTVTLKGLYNPHVIGGTIIVNDVAALTFPSTLLAPSPLAHRALVTPARILYAFLSPLLSTNLNLGLLKVMGKAG